MYKLSVKKLPLWQKLLLTVFFALLAFVLWFVYAILTEEPPNFFPLDDAQAEYTISKNCPHGQGWTDTKPVGTAYCLEYRGNNVLMKADYGNSNFFRITVGKTNIDLQPYLGKKVKNIQGEFTSSNKQCMQNVCTDIGGPFVVVDIQKIEVAE